MRSLNDRPLVDSLLRLRRLRREAAERAHTRAGREKAAAAERLASATQQWDEWREEMPGRERVIADELALRPVALVDIDLAHAAILALDAHLRDLDDVRQTRLRDHRDSVAVHRDRAAARVECLRHERKSERLKERCEVRARRREAEFDELETEELIAPFRFTAVKPFLHPPEYVSISEYPMNCLSPSHLDAARTPPASLSERTPPAVDHAREAQRFAELVRRERKLRLTGEPADAPPIAIPFQPFPKLENAGGPRAVALDGADPVQAGDEASPSYVLAAPVIGAAQAAVVAAAAKPGASPVSVAEVDLGAARSDFEMLAEAIVRNDRPPGTHELRVMFRSTVLAGAVAQVTSSPSLVNVMIAAPVNSRNWLELNQRQLSEDLERRLGRHVVVRIDPIAAAAEVAR